MIRGLRRPAWQRLASMRRGVTRSVSGAACDAAAERSWARLDHHSMREPRLPALGQIDFALDDTSSEMDEGLYLKTQRQDRSRLDLCSKGGGAKSLRVVARANHIVIRCSAPNDGGIGNWLSTCHCHCRCRWADVAIKNMSVWTDSTVSATRLRGGRTHVSSPFP